MNSTKCAVCANGNTEEGFVTVTLERGSTLLIFRNVPARICSNCGEEFISADVNRALLQRAEEEYRRNVQLELLDFAA
ncbi:MAG TPA: type II toxin-antitoxin system MqsA family antitoxin [Thermoanaerobaculia bacterium]|jgi:YgiT-type zinc finger domain-containing protein